MPEHDPRLDLPGSASPPIDGSRWFWVKLAAWGGAIVLLLCAAAVVTMGVSSLLNREKAEPGPTERVVVETVDVPVQAPAAVEPSRAAPDVVRPPVDPIYAPATPEQIAPFYIPPERASGQTAEPVVREAPPPAPSPAEAAPKRPRLMQH
ncbi:hypothetical protein QOZ96_002446 [Brevundimonas nasdae]|uniref:hypothetical protein n=1 Tax=Brevundimonas nasdae TaxID=172043 RepID=UPI001913CD5A|nr:hypothetical protein [Brevundimonas nasdae]MBK6025662.1 hypothetical protein [Brevundimonas nasdae]MDQ0452493.1 hypothetical protein [Brevundimonas nasdae]